MTIPDPIGHMRKPFQMRKQVQISLWGFERHPLANFRFIAAATKGSAVVATVPRGSRLIPRVTTNAAAIAPASFSHG